uniref:Uncharacterized protein n=1 Tax=Anguilla anguilla TaxID=7936 RepID=A0A0E9URH8_ANGAN
MRVNTVWLTWHLAHISSVMKPVGYAKPKQSRLQKSKKTQTL